MATYIVNDVSGVYRYSNGLFGGPKAVDGDIIYLSGTLFPTNFVATDSPVVGSLSPNPGVQFIAYGAFPPVLVASGKTLTIQATGDGTQLDKPIIFSGIYMSAIGAYGTMDIGNHGWYSFEGVSAKFYNVSLTGKSGAENKNCFTAQAASGVNTRVELHNCTIYGAGADLISTKANSNAEVPNARESWIKVYDSYLHSAGQKYNGAVPASNDQILSSHKGVPIYVYGGKIQNGIPFAAAEGHHYCLFAEVDPITTVPLYSGQTNAKPMSNMYVTYGNILNINDAIVTNTIDGVSSNRSYLAELGQSSVKQFALVRDNYIIMNFGGGSNQKVLQNSLGSVSGGHYAFIGNMIYQTGNFAGDNFLIVQKPGLTSITGVVHSNTLIGLGQSSNGTQFIKLAETYVSSGVTFTNLVYNNASIGGKSFLAYNSATIPSGQGSITYASNNFMTASYPFDSFSVDHTFGYIRFSGNLWNASQPANFNAPLFTQTKDNFSATAQITGSRFNYLPTISGNLDFGSGVITNMPHALDGVGAVNVQTDYRGAKARQVYNQEVFPTFFL